MARSQGRFRLDGVEVEHRAASFSKEFDIDPDDMDAVSYDQTLVMVVVCRVGAPGFKETAAGELKRVDKLEIGEAAVRVAKGEAGYEIADMFGIDVAGQFNFEPPDPLAGGEDPEPEQEEEPDPEPDPEPVVEEPQPVPAKAATKKAGAKKAGEAKKAGAKREPAPVAPTSSLVGQHVGGAAMNDERLRDFMSEPV